MCVRDPCKNFTHELVRRGALQAALLMQLRDRDGARRIDAIFSVAASDAI